MSVDAHQVAKISNELKACHDATVKRIGECSLGSLHKGLTHRLDIIKGFKVCADTDFAGGFDKSNAEEHASECSRTGCVIKHSR